MTSVSRTTQESFRSGSHIVTVDLLVALDDQDQVQDEVQVQVQVSTGRGAPR